MRQAKLILHRKIGAERKCICGATMGFDGDWFCKRRRRNNEPNSVDMVEAK